MAAANPPYALQLRAFCSAEISFKPARGARKAAEPPKPHPRYSYNSTFKEAVMGFGRGALLWLLGIPLPIILILALFMHH
jgi:hypothetical protein